MLSFLYRFFNALLILKLWAAQPSSGYRVTYQKDLRLCVWMDACLHSSRFLVGSLRGLYLVHYFIYYSPMIYQKSFMMNMRLRCPANLQTCIVHPVEAL